MGCFSLCFCKHKKDYHHQRDEVSEAVELLSAEVTNNNKGQIKQQKEEAENPIEAVAVLIDKKEEELCSSQSAPITSPENEDDAEQKKTLKTEEECPVPSTAVKSEDKHIITDLNKDDSVHRVAPQNDEGGGFGSGRPNSGSKFMEEESSESLFSLSIDSRKQVFPVEMGDNEVNSPFKPKNMETKAMGLNQNAKDMSPRIVLSALKPTENVGHSKIFETVTPLKHGEEKENLDSNQELKVATSNGKVKTKSMGWGNEMAVETSLSGWLLEGSERLPGKEDSPASVGNSLSEKIDPPKSLEIGRASVLKTHEVKELLQELSSSSCQSPSYCPCRTPMIGTVGSYWRRTGCRLDTDSEGSYK